MVRKIQVFIATFLTAAAFCQAQMALKKSQNEKIPVINKEFLMYKGSKADAEAQESREEHKDSEISAINKGSQLNLSNRQASVAQIGLCLAASIIKSATGSTESVNCDYIHYGTH